MSNEDNDTADIQDFMKVLAEIDELESKKRTPGQKARLGTLIHTKKVILRNRARRNIALDKKEGRQSSKQDLDAADYRGYPTPEGGRRTRRRRKNRRR
jgi:hypothetical protein